MPKVFWSRLLSSRFFTETDALLAEALNYENHPISYSDHFYGDQVIVSS